ncbi:MAG: ribulokinase [Clostridia bacterium]|nr:ribulokinase [Clostridia bacterium]
MSKVSIGIDFGTLSARCVVVDVSNGRELGSADFVYPHAVMDQYLKDGSPLPADWALQDPQDYLDALSTVRKALAKSLVSPEDVIGVGIDFTACTLMTTKADGTPLCFLDEFQHEKHAYVKLWKHHAAQKEANELNAIAEKRGEKFLHRYGGKISSEWMLPKIWQTLREAPQVYEAADRFIEAGDWLIWTLCGKEMRCATLAGYKALWNKRDGYPDDAFYAALDERLRHVVDEKLSRDIYPQGTRAGYITPKAASLTGLLPGTPVAVCNCDAHVAMPTVGKVSPGQMLMIMGTSNCHMSLGTQEKEVPGICGVVEDGIIPDLFGYEAGQSCFGDHYDWFVKNCVPESYAEEAREKNLSLHELLTEKASRQKVGQHGLLALDWWNGNRSVLVDVDLTGLILGLTLTTKPEDIYRALIEATAYGTRIIIDNYIKNGIPVNSLYAGGGIAQKNPMLMQIFADVCNLTIHIVRSTQAPALGSAMFGALVAGRENGGYDTIADAAQAMGGVLDQVYSPIPENHAVYEKIYAEYVRLHDLFGRGGNDVMKRIKSIRLEQN